MLINSYFDTKVNNFLIKSSLFSFNYIILKIMGPKQNTKRQKKKKKKKYSLDEFHS